jgi:hypothetical protein
LAGNTLITITGAGFVSGASGSTVTVGGNVCAVTARTATALTCTTPAGSGVDPVVVTNPDTQTSNTNVTFTYAARPSVSSVSPTGGPQLGGTFITITGTGFDTRASGLTVTVGGNAATNVVLVSGTSITARAPAGTAGAKIVVVTNPDMQVSTNTVNFTYWPACSTGQAINPATNACITLTIQVTGTVHTSGTVTVATGSGASLSNVTILSEPVGSAPGTAVRAGSGSPANRSITYTAPDAPGTTVIFFSYTNSGTKYGTVTVTVS